MNQFIMDTFQRKYLLVLFFAECLNTENQPQAEINIAYQFNYNKKKYLIYLFI